jgi:hypothetical protein
MTTRGWRYPRIAQQSPAGRRGGGACDGHREHGAWRGAAGNVTDPVGGLTTYTELRRVAEATVPDAFNTPRREDVVKPKPAAALASEPRENLSREQIVRALDGPRRRDGAKVPGEPYPEVSLEESGVEALAWYQPHHVWSEGTWGIYLHAEAMLGFAEGLRRKLDNKGVKARGIALPLALMLVLRHELFHAEVELASTWLELTSQGPRHLRYSQKVYEPCLDLALNRKGPPDFDPEQDLLEEALANWCSMEAVKEVVDSYRSAWAKSHWDEDLPDADAVLEVMKEALDESPAGYKDWRQGDKEVTWRLLSNQIDRADTLSNWEPDLLPLEGLLRPGPPVLFEPGDVPVFAVGSEQAVRHLLAEGGT